MHFWVVTSGYFRLLLIVICIMGTRVALVSGQDPAWDDTRRVDWPDAFVEVSIPSTVDGSLQKAYFRSASGSVARPLIVSLHTWSADYRQVDPLIREVLAKDYNYIRPDFRGPNNRSEAMGSSLVASDIDDAISFAIQHGTVDPDNIHVVGVSGGGHATLIAYMKSVHDIRTFSAWVPITDIPAWYEESLGRNAVYAQHIALATTGHEARIDLQEAKWRSPLFMDTPVDRRSESKLYLYAGIHDGYTGSVPITHSLKMYNKLVRDFDPKAIDALVPDELVSRMVVSRYLPGPGAGIIDGRRIHYRKSYDSKIQLIIFEGGHEMLTNVALAHIPSATILAVGDSNGEVSGGWVDMLADMRFQDVIINSCISGNTIGFDNLGRTDLNALKNITYHLEREDPSATRIDMILIMLGTNDCKAVFAEKTDQVPQHYGLLLDKIESYYEGGRLPEIIMISPPPIRDDEFLEEKYQGAAACIRNLHEAFAGLAAERGYTYLDIQTPLWPVRDEILPDGIHLSPQGYSLLGILIDSLLSGEDTK